MSAHQRQPAEPGVLGSDPRLLLGDRQQEALLSTDDLCDVVALVRPLAGLPGNVFLAGFKLVGPYMVVGKYPMYLLTVRGRKSGLPRSVPLAIIARNGKRYIASPYGIVDWVRNLRAAGEATLTRGRDAETVNGKELALGEAALLLQEDVKGGNPFAHYFGVTADSSLEEFERAAASHPVFVLEQK